MSAADVLIAKGLAHVQDYINPESPLTDNRFADLMVELFEGSLYRAYEIEKAAKAEKGPAQTGPVITEHKEFVASHKQGELHGVTAAKLTKAIGFKPGAGDAYKVHHEWNLNMDGHVVSCWDYKGSYRSGFVSTYGPDEVWEKFAKAHGFEYVPY